MKHKADTSNEWLVLVQVKIQLHHNSLMLRLFLKELEIRIRSESDQNESSISHLMAEDGRKMEENFEEAILMRKVKT